MQTVITISGADKSGALARIATLLVRQGHVLKGQQFTGSAEGSRLLRIKLDVAQIDKDRLAQALRSLNPDYGLVSLAFEGQGATEAARAAAPEQTNSSLIKEMAAQFPRIVPLVQAYGGSFSADAREAALFEAGRKIGAYNYTKEWSLGSPLKMPAALRRALVPALEKFGKVEAGDMGVRFADSPFCGSGLQVNCCQFVTGFMQGFLGAGPATKSVQVRKVACRANGDPDCSYTVD
jgi:predicted hydrocarbon binding protein